MAARGSLRLGFEAEKGATHVSEQAMRAPLRCVRAFALATGECVLQLLHVGPGVMAGDHLELDVRVGAGARVVLIAQSAAKLHAMDDAGHAEAHVRLRVAAGGRLEYHPGLTIPYARSSFTQRLDVDLEQGARFLHLERWSAGRIARGERHAYRRVSSRVRVSVDGVSVYRDALELEGARGDAIGVFEGHAYLASGVHVGEPHHATPVGAAERAMEGVYAFGPGRSALRALAHDGVDLARSVARQANAWRRRDALPPIDFGRYGS
jgi:urease accessory protein